MKEFIKKYYKRILKIIILVFDALCIPAAVICQIVSGNMLKADAPCVWTTIGIQCFTCGGTHFVNDLLSFRLIDAMVDNPLLFAVSVYLLITLVALNLYFIFKVRFGLRMLRVMYNVPVIIAWVIAGCAFFFIRNFDAFMHIDEVLPKVIRVCLWMVGLRSEF